MRYAIRFTEEARIHLRQLSARERKTALDRIEAALGDNPARESRNLKVLRPNPFGKYELRAGALRAFFDVNEQSREVLILAIGRKEGSRLWIGGKEVTL